MRIATASTPATVHPIASHLPALLGLTDAQARDALVLVGRYLIGQPVMPVSVLVEAIDEVRS